LFNSNFESQTFGPRYAGLPLNSFHDSSLSAQVAQPFVQSMWGLLWKKGDLLPFSSYSPTGLCRDTSDCITLMDFDSGAALMFLK